MHGVYNTADCYGVWIKQLMTYVGGALLPCRAHSIRKSAVKWAVRCGIDSLLIVRAGRWAGAHASFMVYIEDGLKMSEEWVGGLDPIFKFWTFKVTVGDFTSITIPS